MRYKNIIFILLMFTTFLGSAVAQESVPGDSCSSFPPGAYRESGGPELSGIFHQLICESSLWVPANPLEFQATSGGALSIASDGCDFNADCSESAETNLPIGAFVMNYLHDSGADCGNDFPSGFASQCNNLDSPTDSSNSYWDDCGGDQCASGRIQCARTTPKYTACTGMINTGYCYCVP